MKHLCFLKTTVIVCVRNIPLTYFICIVVNKYFIGFGIFIDKIQPSMLDLFLRSPCIVILCERFICYSLNGFIWNSDQMGHSRVLCRM